MNQRDGFVLIETKLGSPIHPGTSLVCYKNNRTIAALRATPDYSFPYRVADILSGTPITGAHVAIAPIENSWP